MPFYVEASGCTHACRHCAASGKPPYGSFYSLQELRQVASEWGKLTPYYEASVHPEFPEIMHPDISCEAGVFATNGFGLAERPDFKAVFSRLREFGFHAVSFTVHGLEQNHDWFVCRKGAFAAMLAAGRRACECGFGVWWNVFLNNRNMADIPDLVQLAVKEYRIRPCLDVPYHRVSRRMWRFEKLRPRAADVAGVLAGLDPDIWQGPFKDRPLSELTEGAWMHYWSREPDSDALKHPFEPRTWPLRAPFDNLALYLSRGRQVWFDPECGEPILLGGLHEGRDALLEHLQSVPAPPNNQLQAQEVPWLDRDVEHIHLQGFSVRYRAISLRLFGNERPGEVA